MGVRTPSGAPALVATLPPRRLPKSVHFSMAQVCTFRWPLTPGTAVPSGAAIRPPRRSCTYCLSSPFVASFAGFGRFARRSACH